jgi:hypothetical protein
LGSVAQAPEQETVAIEMQRIPAAMQVCKRWARKLILNNLPLANAEQLPGSSMIPVSDGH